MFNYFTKYTRIAMLLLPLAIVSSCSDDIVDNGGGNVIDNDFKGEMIHFAVGTTENQSRAGDTKTYYMPDGSHFTCRMYYKAKAGSDDLDVESGSDQTAWLKVSGNVGNSLYWNKAYNPVGDNKGKGGIDDYGNDFGAAAFYWQNRKEHAFLAWTDLNHASTVVAGPNPGQLKFEEDEIYKVYTGETSQQWVTKSYEIYGVDDSFSSLAEMQNYVQQQTAGTTIGETSAFKKSQEALKSQERFDFTADANYHYQHGWQYKYSKKYAAYAYDGGIDEASATKRSEGWIQYLMFFNKLPVLEIPDGAVKVMDTENPDVVVYLENPDTHEKLAAAEARVDAEGRYLDKDGNVTTDPELYAYDYYQTDIYGNIKYDEANPRYTFYYKEHQDKENVKVVEEYPVLAFDLTRGTKTNMTEQPDIVQAVELQAPTGATQESNRVNLYFKHQFSQVQVNLKNAADNSVSIEASDILSVELLGVTEKGYVFTQLNAEGKVKPAAYQEIDFSKYTEEQLRLNQFGTAFNMFELQPSETAYGYLKSYNAIAYGQLQAIRITWKEPESQGGYVHASTYRIPNTDLMNLRSGVRYVWNIEIRRGTLAIIRAEIVDWDLPTDEQHNGNTDGTIQN